MAKYSFLDNTINDQQIFFNIANELAEANRLRRIELKTAFLDRALQELQTYAVDSEGNYSPTQENIDAFNAEVEIINLQFEDHAGEGVNN